MTLDPQLQQALSSFTAAGPILVATDFDGVLAPLVADPSTSRPVDGSMELLRELATMPGVFVAIVSGRHLAALQALTGVTVDDDIVLVGSHGAEPDRELPLDLTFDDAARDRLARATSALEAVAAAHPPTRIEHKPAGVVLHTRNVAADIAAAATRAALAIDIPGVDVMDGKQIVELSALSVTKGSALLALAKEFGTRASLYLGDDVTDERAFVTLAADPGNVTIKVGAGDTAATHRIDAPLDVLPVLETLRAVRSALRTS
ncbi:MAG TPA: trehalose-phosphatase [Flexivirga sp.]|uniref:trehalose-phosphatase n=1 Tax=Flexivirga sp. TaxID=1962927 RepID=UPI002BAE3078|nr:trehalose-phosphatase [Flexivirga sp.]HWC22200.1 trehalose-phosphatase [Flexivirga sp.]